MVCVLSLIVCALLVLATVVQAGAIDERYVGLRGGYRYKGEYREDTGNTRKYHTTTSAPIAPSLRFIDTTDPVDQCNGNGWNDDVVGFFCS
jgi:hypothetical protein